MNKRIVVAALCATALASLAFATPASATNTHPSHGSTHASLGKVTTIADNLLSPLSFAVDNAGNSYVAQNFSGTLTKISPKGKMTTMVSAPGWEIGAVSEQNGTVYYAQGIQDQGKALLMALPRHGDPKQVADLGAYEKSVNPDQINTYGFSGLSKKCAAQIDPNGPAGPASHKGVVDSHPYASVAVGKTIYVADAAGNDILRVRNGKVSTVAVLPPTPALKVTKAMATAFGFPACVAGHKYTFEPVPTDIEVGPHGWLYVTSIPGGPEDNSLGARGAVYKVNPNSGKIVSVASGFVGATGLAVDNRTGVVLVAELFGGADGSGQISIVAPWSHKAVKTVAMTSPAAIELSHNKIYVTKDAFVPDATGAPQAIGKLVVANGASTLCRSVHRYW